MYDQIHFFGGTENAVWEQDETRARQEQDAYNPPQTPQQEVSSIKLQTVSFLPKHSKPKPETYRLQSGILPWMNADLVIVVF